ncbi:MAG: hypothetical protein ACRCYS_08750, partial [Beijerinckiaceae bacterium]
YYLRRLTLRAPHAPGCPFGESPPLSGDSRPSALRVRPAAEAICHLLRIRRASDQDHACAGRQASARHAPRLAIELWRLIEIAGLNRVEAAASLTEPSSLTGQLAALRRAARKVQVAAEVRLDEVLSTYPGDVEAHSAWHAKALAVWPRFRGHEQPQAIMVGLARAADGRILSTAAGHIACEVDVGFMSAAAHRAGPPFLFMLAGVVDPKRDAIVPVRAFAQPVYTVSRLVPVESTDERQLLGALLAFQQNCRIRFPSLAVTIEKPLFDIETANSFVRPPFVMTLANTATASMERLAVQHADTNPCMHDDECQGLFGRLLTVPRSTLEGDARMQAGWLIDAIYGAPLTPRVRSATKSWGADNAALFP